MPYVVLTILLIRGLMLPGALSGISYYLKPELSRLKDTQVSLPAASKTVPDLFSSLICRFVCLTGLGGCCRSDILFCGSRIRSSPLLR